MSENIMYRMGPVFNQEEQAEETTRGGRNQEVAIYVQCNLGTTASTSIIPTVMRYSSTNFPYVIPALLVHCFWSHVMNSCKSTTQ
jgi:hypothetical protein